MLGRPHPQAARIVPEVIQISRMDCGPAALMALMQGFGVNVSFGRLREVCQTTVDGTSISTMNEVANLLGLETEEVMAPLDHVMLPESGSLPAIVVVQNEIGASHFIVLWSVLGSWVQVMDPAHGRHWLSRRRLEEQLYRHTDQVSAAQWREWAGTAEFQEPLDRRLRELGLDPKHVRDLRERALADPGWRGVAALDATCRMTKDMVVAHAIRRGREATAMVDELFAWASDAQKKTDGIPAVYWSARPAPGMDRVDPDELSFHGAVLVRSRGRREQGPDRESLSEELAATLAEEPPRPGRTLLGMLARDGLTAPLVLLGATLVAAALVLGEALLLRGFLDMGSQLGLATQRAAAMAIFLVLLALAMAIRLPILRGALTMGRALEIRLRMAFLSKIPRLSDRYFHSRLISDMAERCHGLHRLRHLPVIGARLLEGCAQIVFTVAGIAWLDPSLAPWAILVAVVSIALPLALQPIMMERELRLRTHTGGLLHYYLDALLGLIPIRVHGAQQSMAREQEGRMVDWSRAAMRFHTTSTWVAGVLALAGSGMAVLMVFVMSQGTLGSALLVVFWALSLPMLGQRVALLARQYPELHSVALRVFEMLGAPEEESAEAGADERAETRGVAISMSGVTVEAGGHEILRDVDLTVQPGEHVAIVGPSGAGKSSLVGLLMGWHRPRSGSLEVDGRPLTGAWLGALRRATAWVDPAVQLWNQPLLDNLLYGSELRPEKPIASVLHDAELRALLERLPEGMQTYLGEGGGLVSGGEGQRVRLGRALMHQDARLVILDEAFRGLDRDARRRLTERARAWWKDATLLFVSHDISDTCDFERVLVIEDGRLVEDGAPADLLGDPESRYGALVAGDRAMQSGAWASGDWRRLWLENGRLREEEHP